MNEQAERVWREAVAHALHAATASAQIRRRLGRGEGAGREARVGGRLRLLSDVSCAGIHCDERRLSSSVIARVNLRGDLNAHQRRHTCKC